MKQYGTEKPIFRTGWMPQILEPQKKTEAFWGSSYSKLFRDTRRSMNKDALKWWRMQVDTEGKPCMYHCWGW